MDRQRSRLQEPQEVVRYIHPYQLMPYIVIMTGIWGFLGAKLFDAAEHFQELRYQPLEVLLSRSGFAYYGGLIFGALTYLYIGYRHKIPLIHMADIGSPGMMLAYGIGRIGCQLAGDGDWGIVNTHPKPFSWLPNWAWAFNYPHNVINEGIPIPGCDGRYCRMLELPVYPTPLYEIVTCLLLFVILWSIRKKIKTPGVIFGIYLVLNGIERFFIEKIRVDTRYDIFGFHPTQAEIISTLLVIGGALFIRYSRRRAYSAKPTA